MQVNFIQSLFKLFSNHMLINICWKPTWLLDVRKGRNAAEIEEEATAT